MRFVGWVERSETHPLGEAVMPGVMGFAALDPSYELTGRPRPILAPLSTAKKCGVSALFVNVLDAKKSCVCCEKLRDDARKIGAWRHDDGSVKLVSVGSVTLASRSHPSFSSVSV